MPRFYLHYREPDDLIVDQEGLELPDLEAAKAEAERAGRDILAEKVKLQQPLNHDVIEIASEDGQVLAKVALSRLIKLP